MNTATILLLISLLTKEVNLLEQELAQQQAVVATSTYVAPIYNPPVTQNPTGQPVLGDVQTSTPESCTLTATDIGSTSSPETALSWTLTGFPASPVIFGDLSPWNEPNPPITFNGQIVEALPSVAYGLHAGVQVLNPYTLESQGIGSNESQKIINGWYPGIEANFGGVVCDIVPTTQE